MLLASSMSASLMGELDSKWTQKVLSSYGIVLYVKVTLIRGFCNAGVEV